MQALVAIPMFMMALFFLVPLFVIIGFVSLIVLIARRSNDYHRTRRRDMDQIRTDIDEIKKELQEIKEQLADLIIQLDDVRFR